MQNIYPEFFDRIVARWIKAIPAAVVVKRLNPYNLDEPPGDVVLLSQEKDGIITHPYETAVIELYSEREANAFKLLNKKLIGLGYIAEYSDTAPVTVDLSNSVSDDELRSWLNLKSQAFSKKLAEISSPVVLERLKSLVTDTTPLWVMHAIDKRLEQLRGEPSRNEPLHERPS